MERRSPIVVTPASYAWDTAEGLIGPTDNPGGAYPNLVNTHVLTKTGSYLITQIASYTATLTATGFGTGRIPGALSGTTMIGTLTVRQASVAHVDPHCPG